MANRRVKCLALLSSLAVLSQLPIAARASEPVTMETYEVRTLRLPAPPHRFITLAGTFNTNFTFFDGDTGKMEGNISAGYIPNLAISPDGNHIFVSETFWTHGARGQREDMVTVYDTKTLSPEKEIPIASRALLGTMHNFGISQSAERAYVYSMQPASSVIWVDLKGGSVGGKIEIPGCAMIYPFGNEGFSSLCGDGSLATVTISDSGKTSLSHSKPFFDPNKDPIFDDSLVDIAANKAFFISYTGLVYEAKLGASPVIEKPWSMQQAAGLTAAGTGVNEMTWRPGGHQFVAYHKADGHLFVLMHTGNFWSQDVGGSEIWVLDTKKHSLISRFSLWAAPTSGLGSKEKPVYFRNLQVSQDEHPVIFLLNPEGNDLVMDAETGAVIRKVEAASGGSAFVSGL